MVASASRYVHQTVALRHVLFFFFFNDTATTEIYTLSLHDALPISRGLPASRSRVASSSSTPCRETPPTRSRRASSGSGSVADRKSTRLNSSHSQISYAVFCLKKKNTQLAAKCRTQVSRHIILPEHS